MPSVALLAKDWCLWVPQMVLPARLVVELGDGDGDVKEGGRNLMHYVIGNFGR